MSANPGELSAARIFFFILGEVRAYIAANQQIADGLLEVIVKWNYRRKNIDDLRSGR